MTTDLEALNEHIYWITKYMIKSNQLGRAKSIKIDDKEYFVNINIALVMKCDKCGQELKTKGESK